mgnify:CR=1 FL=1
MKKMQELRKYTDTEIESKIFELKQEIFNLRFKQATGQLTDTARVKKARKQIARLFTILTERKSIKE